MQSKTLTLLVLFVVLLGMIACAVRATPMPARTPAATAPEPAATPEPKEQPAVAEQPPLPRRPASHIEACRTCGRSERPEATAHRRYSSLAHV